MAKELEAARVNALLSNIFCVCVLSMMCMLCCAMHVSVQQYLAVKLRAKNGAYMGAIDAKEFSLPNPGGGQDLLEEANFTLVRGRRYGLIGRNGKGKSTLLRWLAARRVGNFPPEVTVHYVSQDVTLNEQQEKWKPIQVGVLCIVFQFVCVCVSVCLCVCVCMCVLLEDVPSKIRSVHHVFLSCYLDLSTLHPHYIYTTPTLHP